MKEFLDKIWNMPANDLLSDIVIAFGISILIVFIAGIIVRKISKKK